MKTLSAALLSIVVFLGAVGSPPVLAAGGHGSHFRGSHQFRHQQFRHHQQFRQHRPFPRFRHHNHSSFGVFIGAPLLLAPWYPPYSPATVVVPASPPVYIERAQEATPVQEPQAFWYYCRESETYYPYTKECPGPWQRVVPQPPPPS